MFLKDIVKFSEKNDINVGEMYEEYKLERKHAQTDPDHDMDDQDLKESKVQSFYANREAVTNKLPVHKEKKIRGSTKTSPIPKQGQRRQRAARRTNIVEYISTARSARTIHQKVSLPGRPGGAKATTVFELLKFKYKVQ